MVSAVEDSEEEGLEEDLAALSFALDPSPIDYEVETRTMDY